MLQYRGQYRVVFEMDRRMHKPCEFAFIPCKVKKGTTIYRRNDDELLVYIPSVQIGNRLLKEYPKLFRKYQQSSCETVLVFKESDMKDAATVLKAWTSRKNFYPGSKKNLKFQNTGLILNWTQ